MTIYFDIDDTLYDRGLPFISAVQEFFPGKISDPRRAYRLCTARGNEVFLPSQRGEITMDEMVVYRWCKGFADAGIYITPEEALRFQALYRQKQGCIFLSPVLETMLRDSTARGITLGVITNGPAEKQWSKIRCLGLERFMERSRIIVSGDIGIDKPDPAIFRLAQERCGEAPGSIIYVGDALRTDIAPAKDLGWQTIWFNRTEKAPPVDCPADTVVESEEALAAVVCRMH